MVNAACRGASPSRPSEIGSFPIDPPQLVGLAGAQLGHGRRDQVARPSGQHHELRQLGTCEAVSRVTSRCPGARRRPSTASSVLPRPGAPRPCCRPAPTRCPARRPRRRRPRPRHRAWRPTLRRRSGASGGRTERRPSLALEPRHRRRAGLLVLALGEPAGDAGPEPFGQGLHRVAHGGRHLAQAVELGPAAWAAGQVRLELGELIAIDGIERVGAQELAGLFVRHHTSTPLMPASARTARMRRMPLRIRLLTVPSGWSSSWATSR